MEEGSIWKIKSKRKAAARSQVACTVLAYASFTTAKLERVDQVSEFSSDRLISQVAIVIFSEKSNWFL